MTLSVSARRKELRASGWGLPNRQTRSVNQSSHLTWPQTFNENLSHKFYSKVAQSIPCIVGGASGGKEKDFLDFLFDPQRCLSLPDSLRVFSVNKRCLQVS